MMDNEMNLRDLGTKGYIFMGIKAEDTPHNAAIHNAFRELARVECRNDYTFALGKLLEYYEQDAKVQMLWSEVQSLRQEIEDLKKQQAPKEKKNDDGVF